MKEKSTKRLQGVKEEEEGEEEGEQVHINSDGEVGEGRNKVPEREEVDEKMTVYQFTCFEDVLEMVGSRGRWNVLLFFLTGYPIMLAAFINMSYLFLGATPDHWCHVEILTEANWTQEQIVDLAIPYNNETGEHSKCTMYDYNYTKAALLGYDAALAHLDDLTGAGGAPKEVYCISRDFNQTEQVSSTVTEWDLVCDRRALYSTTQAVNQLGFLIGSAITPIFTDAFGRRPFTLSLVVLSLVLGLSSCFASSAEMFITLKFGLSVVVNAYYLCSFLIVMELCSPSTRSFFGTMFVLFWALGIMILPGITYLFRPWRHLQAALVLPYGILLVSFCLLPESPRWLLLKGRLRDAEGVLTRIAAANRRQISSRRVFRTSLRRVSRQMAAEKQDEEGKSTWRNGRQKVVAAVRHLVSPYRTIALAIRMAVLFVLWFTVALVYYGVSLNATNISADPLLYMFLGGLCEIPAYLMLWLLVARVGRRLTLIGLYLMCGACIAVNAALMFTMPDVPVAAKITLSLSGKMGIAAAFHLVYLYTAELFSTRERSLALGHSSLCGRFGSIISPYINDLLGNRAAWAPSAVFSGLTLLAASLALLLPETRNKILPEHNHRSRHVTNEGQSLRSLRDAATDN